MELFPRSRPLPVWVVLPIISICAAIFATGFIYLAVETVHFIHRHFHFTP